MIVKAGSTDVTTYFVLRKAADGTALTGATIADIDIGYTRSGADHVAKQDVAALATPDAAHEDNHGIEVDATVCPGLYRIDWPDAAFAAGAREVVLTVVYATAFSEHLRVELTPAAADLINIAGAAVATGTAQLGVNVVTKANVDFGALEKASLNAATPASVVGAVGSIAAGGIANAAFAADVGSTAYATNVIALAADKAIIQNNLDHLALTPTVAADMTAEVADNTILSRVLANGDTSAFVPSTDGLHAAGVDLDAILADTNELQVDDYPTSIAAVKGDTAAILADTGTDGVVLAADAITAAKIADDAIAAEHLATGAIVAATFAAGAINAAAIAADAIGASELAADAVTEIWAASSRTLTQSAAAVATAMSGSDLTVTRSVSYAATLSGLTISATWAKILLTAKARTSDTDAQAQIQIQKSVATTGDGLLYIYGMTPTVAGLAAADASLTVDQAAGTIAIVIKDEATAVMASGTYTYDVKCLITGGTSEQLSGEAVFTVQDAVTATV